MTSMASEQQSVDDNFRALLEGLRTTLPGVQLTSAFLLILPFQASFVELSTAERVAYHVAFGSSLLSTVLLMAPSSHQRLRAKPDGDLARQSSLHLRVAIRLAIVGSTLFAAALCSVAYLVASVLLPTPTAAVLAAVIGGALAWSWFYLPVVYFTRRR